MAVRHETNCAIFDTQASESRPCNCGADPGVYLHGGRVPARVVEPTKLLAVARAIYGAQWNDPHCAPPDPFEEVVKDPRHALIEQARAAVIQMLNPTVAMVQAAAPAGTDHAMAWRYMIRAILEEV